MLVPPPRRPCYIPEASWKRALAAYEALDGSVHEDYILGYALGDRDRSAEIQELEEQLKELSGGQAQE